MIAVTLRKEEITKYVLDFEFRKVIVSVIKILQLKEEFYTKFCSSKLMLTAGTELNKYENLMIFHLKFFDVDKSFLKAAEDVLNRESAELTKGQ